jgi:hypothetical protein
MRRTKPLLTAVVALVALLGPAAGTVSAASSSTLSGYEYAFTSTDGKFAGTAGGALRGPWQAEVRHTALCLSCTPTAKIDGGAFKLASIHNGRPAVATGAFVGGTIRVTNPGANCSNQTFAVDGVLAGVGWGSGGKGSGTLAVTLTHYRHRLAGKCVTYGAAVRGALSLSF